MSDNPQVDMKRRAFLLIVYRALCMIVEALKEEINEK
jgi:hypothetical protein